MANLIATLTTDLESVTTALTTAFATSDIIAIISVGIGAVASYVVLWFGIRYVMKLVKAGVFRGKFRA